ncbi:pickpocket protein 28 [Halyomorpha halys]|uniref:pickpocket protein 28 n=1 Tax=Halyomorpha halys TaxID=286706 RepID=UPI0006D4FCB1
MAINKASNRLEPRLVRFRNSLRSSLKSPALATHVRTYCDTSSIHGIRYIAESSRPFFERLLWLVILLLSFVLSGYYTIAVWEETPIAVDEIEGAHDNSRIPFPAVTICSNSKISSSAALGKSKKDLHILRFLCGEPFPNSNGISVNRINQTSPPFDATCSLDITREDQSLWQRSCLELFQRVLTEQGICYSFNTYHPRDIFREDVLFSDMKASDLGYRGADFGTLPNGSQFQCGAMKDMEQPLILHEDAKKHLKCGNYILRLSLFNRNANAGFCTSKNTTGFKVIIHNPLDVPTSGVRRLIWAKEEPSVYSTIDLKTEFKVLVKVEASITSFSNDLLWFPPKKRECYQSSERYLRYFRIYSDFNCRLECLTNKTLELCNCVDFYMPRVNGTKQCRRVDLPCVFDTIDLFKKRDHCKCYPACFNVRYTSQTRVTYDPGQS